MIPQWRKSSRSWARCTDILLTEIKNMLLHKRQVWKETSNSCEEPTTIKEVWSNETTIETMIETWYKHKEHTTIEESQTLATYQKQQKHGFLNHLRFNLFFGFVRSQTNAKHRNFPRGEGKRRRYVQCGGWPGWWGLVHLSEILCWRGEAWKGMEGYRGE